MNHSASQSIIEATVSSAIKRIQTIPFDLKYDTRFIDEIISIVPKE